MCCCTRSLRALAVPGCVLTGAEASLSKEEQRAFGRREMHIWGTHNLNLNATLTLTCNQMLLRGTSVKKSMKNAMPALSSCDLLAEMPVLLAFGV